MIEVIVFRLRQGVDVDAFLELDGRVQTGVAYRSPGLLRRTIARDGERWLVLQIWATPEACVDGARALESSDLGRSFLDLVDPTTITVDRFGDVG